MLAGCWHLPLPMLLQHRERVGVGAAPSAGASVCPSPGLASREVRGEGEDCAGRALAARRARLRARPVARPMLRRVHAAAVRAVHCARAPRSRSPGAHSRRGCRADAASAGKRGPARNRIEPQGPGRAAARRHANLARHAVGRQAARGGADPRRQGRKRLVRRAAGAAHGAARYLRRRARGACAGARAAGPALRDHVGRHGGVAIPRSASAARAHAGSARSRRRSRPPRRPAPGTSS